jgi:hypothetical protein
MFALFYLRIEFTSSRIVSWTFGIGSEYAKFNYLTQFIDGLLLHSLYVKKFNWKKHASSVGAKLIPRRSDNSSVARQSGTFEVENRVERLHTGYAPARPSTGDKARDHEAVQSATCGRGKTTGTRVSCNSG